MLYILCSVAINVGIVLGYITTLAFSGLPPDTAWRMMLAAGVVMPVVILAMSTFIMVESPRFLFQQGRVDEAREVMRELCGDELLVEETMGEMERAVREEEGYARNPWK